MLLEQGIFRYASGEPTMPAIWNSKCTAEYAINTVV